MSSLFVFAFFDSHVLKKYGSVCRRRNKIQVIISNPFRDLTSKAHNKKTICNFEDLTNN